MATMKRFIKRHGIRAECEMVGENPSNPDWQDAYHYKVILRGRFDGERRQMTTYFSMGYAHSREPAAEDVLDCLASDSASFECAAGFEDWARDFGYDEDSRKAEKIYRACEKQAAKLKQFVGSDYNELLYETERL